MWSRPVTIMALSIYHLIISCTVIVMIEKRYGTNLDCLIIEVISQSQKQATSVWVSSTVRKTKHYRPQISIVFLLL